MVAEDVGPMISNFRLSNTFMRIIVTHSGYKNNVLYIHLEIAKNKF